MVGIELGEQITLCVFYFEFENILCFMFNLSLYFSGSNYYVRILSTIDRELLKPSASVALHKHSNALVDVLPPEADSSITMLQAGTVCLSLGFVCCKEHC